MCKGSLQVMRQVVQHVCRQTGGRGGDSIYIILMLGVSLCEIFEQTLFLSVEENTVSHIARRGVLQNFVSS